MKLCTEINCKIIRMSFLILSACGWLVFLIGFGKLLSTVQRSRENDSPDDIVPSTSLIQGLTGPMWLFAVASTLLYITYTLQVYRFTDNISQVLHCITILFNFFFTSGGILTLVIAILHQSKGFTRNLLMTTLSDDTGMKMILVGTAVALIVLWIGLGVWPLLDIRRTRYRGYTELQQSTS